MNLNELIPFNQFKYWFTRSKTGWNVINKEDPEYSSQIVCNGGTFEPEDEATFLDFKMFMTRPEYFLGSQAFLDDFTLPKMKEDYETLICGSLLQRAFEACGYPDKSINACASLLSWLSSTDFYTCPASTKYHEAFEGGLVYHSLKVYNHAIELIKLDKFSKVSLHSAALIALTHDWCKIGNYESFMKNVKDDSGKWYQEVAYRHAPNSIPLGHGVTSMFLVGKFAKLSTSESLAIRWHMGRWNVADNEQNDYQRANEKCPEVLLLQFADQLAIVDY